MPRLSKERLEEIRELLKEHDELWKKIAFGALKGMGQERFRRLDVERDLIKTIPDLLAELTARDQEIAELKEKIRTKYVKCVQRNLQ